MYFVNMYLSAFSLAVIKIMLDTYMSKLCIKGYVCSMKKIKIFQIILFGYGVATGDPNRIIRQKTKLKTFIIFIHSLRFTYFFVVKIPIWTVLQD